MMKRRKRERERIHSKLGNLFRQFINTRKNYYPHPRRPPCLQGAIETCQKLFCSNSGSGCGSVGRTSDTGGLRFESSHQHNLYWTFMYCQLHWKDENKEKRPGMGHFLNYSVQKWFATFRSTLASDVLSQSYSVFKKVMLFLFGTRTWDLVLQTLTS